MRRTPHLRGEVRLALCTSGDGPPFVFQHGLCGDGEQPLGVFPTESAFRCVTLECRGHGQSELGPLAELSLASFAQDVASAIAGLDAGPVVLGGISMGAAIALRLAVCRPELVRALVLVRPAWVAAPAPANMRPNAFVGSLLAQHPPEIARARFEASEVAAELADAAPDNLASLRGFFARVPQQATAVLLTRISADGPGLDEADIARLDLPALVIGHERDMVHPLSHAEALTRLLRAARLVRVTPKASDAAAHRADVRAALAKFLKETADGA